MLYERIHGLRYVAGRPCRGVAVIAVALLCVTLPAGLKAQELALSAADFAKLDTFEGHSLQRADKVFGDKQYRQAIAEYEAFLLEFARSAATPYAIYRKGRSQQLDNKRFEAIKTFDEVLDYFPDDIPYAAAALFQIGQSHWDNGNIVEALKAWARLADDEDYRKQPLAAGAVNRLADALREQGKPAEAARYYWQTAVEFRKSNGDAARHAITYLVYFYIRTQPDVKKLREFYDQVLSFEHNPRAPEDGNFWWSVIENVRLRSQFPADKAEDRVRYFRYWTDQMANKHPAWDDFQIARIEFLLQADGDAAKWFERIDQQFDEHQKPDDFGRIVKWMQVLAAHPEKVKAYYAKLDFAKMSYDQINNLLRVCFDQIRNNEMADVVFQRLPLDKISDDQRYHLARYLWHKGQRHVETVCGSMADPDRGQMEILRYYNWRCWNSGYFEDKYLTLAEAMTKVPAVASEAFWMKAEILQRRSRWSEAVAAYLASERVPGSLWRIVDCLLADKKADQALAQLQEIENFFKNEASKAALRIAYVHRDAGRQPQYAASLRSVLKKYPQSAESSAAHLELEKLGLTRIGGGMDAQ